MKVYQNYVLSVLLSSFFLFSVCAIEALSYDYSATIECLPEPLSPQYGGGIITNPEFNKGLKGWFKFGDGEIDLRKSKGGNNFVVAHSRKNPNDSISQEFYSRKGELYIFSAWIQASEENNPIIVLVKTKTSYITVGEVIAERGCWSMLKGGFSVDSSGYAEIYFESKNTNASIWLDNVSLQPFTKEQWRSHQEESVEKARKCKVKIYTIDSQGENVIGAQITIKQNKVGFPFGSAINKNILTNIAYQNWFSPRFTVTTFENEMKWYSTEPSRNKEDYSVPDEMLNFAKQHGILVRGHTIFWDDDRYQPWWVKSLSPDELRIATEKRTNSIVSKYGGQVIAWDVVNENLHFSFYEDKLGKNFSADIFHKAHLIDQKATMFLNDYNTIEENRDGKSTPAMYLQKLREIQSYQGNNIQTGIGLEGHFKIPNIAYMRSAIDTLAVTKLPIWLTEVDVQENPNQAQYLEEILREAHSHPAVQGIILWTPWSPNGCWKMCLTDNNFKNLPTGEVVDKLIREWTNKDLAGITNVNGLFETSLFYGDYEVTITHPNTNSNLTQHFHVESTNSPSECTHYFQIDE